MVHARGARSNHSCGDRPQILTVWPECIPAALRSFPHWVAWKFGPPRADGKRPKPPLDPRTGAPASPTDERSWAPFSDAIWAYRDPGFADGECAGIGFVLTPGDPFTAIDLDKCRDPASGLITPAAQRIITRLNSYAEVSPSDTGVRVFVSGKKPGPRCKTGGVEIYDRERFVTLTGHHLRGTPETVEQRQKELDAVYQEYLGAAARGARPAGSAPTGLTDEEVIELAKRSRNGRAFEALFGGDISAHGGDASLADYALAARLAHVCGPDPERIIRLMMLSGLVRGKWNREDYLPRTVAAVLRQKRQFRTSEPCPNYSNMNTGVGVSIQTNSDTPSCPVYFRSTGLCPSPSPRKHLVSRLNPNREAALRLPCRRWTCVSCAQTKRQEVMEALHLGLHRLKQPELYLWNGATDQFDAIAKRIRRAGGLYFGVRHGPQKDRFFLLSTVAIDGAERVSAAEALTGAHTTLADLKHYRGGSRARTVVCSRHWPKPPRARKWTSGGDVPASSDHLERTIIAEQARNPGFRAAILAPGDAVMEFAPEMPEADRAPIRDRVLGHT